MYFLILLEAGSPRSSCQQVSPEACVLGLQTAGFLLCAPHPFPHLILCLSVCPGFLSLYRHQSDWIRAHSNGLILTKLPLRNFPDGPVVRNLPSNAADAGSIPGQGTKIPHAPEQVSLCALSSRALEPVCAATGQCAVTRKKEPCAQPKKR